MKIQPSLWIRSVSPVVSAIIMVAALMFGAASFSQAEEAEEQTRKTPTISEPVYKRMSAIQELIDLKDYAGAMAELADMEKRSKNYNGYEKGNMYNTGAFLWYAQDNFPRAIEYYKKVLEQGEDIPIAMEVQTKYSLAQLYFVQENYQQSLYYMEQWFKVAKNPNPQAHMFVAQVYYVMERYRDVVPNIQMAMDSARERGLEIKENWWGLMMASYFELENWDKVMEILEIMVRDFPKKEYWIQLAGVYGQEGFELKQVYAFMSAYYQGFLNRESDIVSLAGLLLQQEVPHEAAQVLAKGFEDEIVERTSKNLQMLGQAWQLSQEIDEAIEAYEAAGKLSDDGEISARLASVYLDRDRYGDCVRISAEAIRKGGLRREADAYIVKGMCEFNLDRLTASKKTFREASRIARNRKDDISSRTSQSWIRYIDNETNRRNELARSAQS